jgi:hypothetical protein
VTAGRVEEDHVRTDGEASGLRLAKRCGGGPQIDDLASEGDTPFCLPKNVHRSPVSEAGAVRLIDSPYLMRRLGAQLLPGRLGTVVGLSTGAQGQHRTKQREVSKWEHSQPPSR